MTKITTQFDNTAKIETSDGLSWFVTRADIIKGVISLVLTIAVYLASGSTIDRRLRDCPSVYCFSAQTDSVNGLERGGWAGTNS